MTRLLSRSIFVIGMLGHAADSIEAQSARRASLDTTATIAYVTKAMKDWQVPGLAIAVVRNDSIVLLRGFGVRQVGSSEAVTANTIFAAGSTTKGLTAAAVGMALKNRQRGWNATVRAIMPEFRVADTTNTRLITVADLLGNRGGGPIPARETSIWLDKPVTRDSVLRSLATIPSFPLRMFFAYSNVMYTVAGELIPHLSRVKFDDFVRDSILLPLGMSRTTLSVRALESMTDVARPHMKSGDTVRAIPYRNLDNVAPAGAINSSARDLAQWVRLQLGHGQIDGKRIIDSTVITDTWRPLMVVPNEGAWKLAHPGVDLLTWGMGWSVANYREQRLVEHYGVIDGMHALIGMIPEQRLGIVILSNLGFASNQLPTALRYWIYDRHLGAPQRDWSAELLRARTTPNTR